MENVENKIRLMKIGENITKRRDEERNKLSNFDFDPNASYRAAHAEVKTMKTKQMEFEDMLRKMQSHSRKMSAGRADRFVERSDVKTVELPDWFEDVQKPMLMQSNFFTKTSADIIRESGVTLKN